MKRGELDAIKDAFGLSDENDPERLRRLIEARLREMNTVDRLALEMKIGMRAREIESQTPGAPYSPQTWSLLVAALLTGTLSGLSAYWALGTNHWMLVRIVAGFFSFMWFLMGWRALSRVVYRALNKRDM